MENTSLTKSLLLGTVLAATPLAVLGQMQSTSAYGPSEGDWELTLGGSGSNDNSFDSGAGGLNGSIGYFFSDALELSLRQDLSLSDLGGSSSWSAGTRMALDYHFDLGRTRPFVGVNAGGFYGDDVPDTFAAGLEAGIKYYVKPQTFVFLMGEYAWLFDDASDANNTFDDGRFVYSLGIGFNF